MCVSACLHAHLPPLCFLCLAFSFSSCSFHAPILVAYRSLIRVQPQPMRFGSGKYRSSRLVNMVRSIPVSIGSPGS
ncbi:hypothetical protein J3E72DRAFT_338928 [Bipolaris maydis]|uniref:uncharacterized protein n=1 Tax=Cochliobolus heterostrophus TaxID=5016 RepID=UPI0024DB0EEB|nr:hypothetical protein J3E73DRAFT_332711 [Bipolaris maydis]KAJ5058394.1 hypothetical protein J3E74DRAFT_360084 [Bipolaris maydis]KAJ6195636.1 hypothetical protein J3E72DRAFT_338928 [Bipolaris maydis]KAJ6206423.1 hypothetical protein PSV09DRAFT_2334529 [Bipolaris maydis]KAJ6269132.1 hypothetical protein PSV08DRAFT_314481 [Bipolaris maydis]